MSPRHARRCHREDRHLCASCLDRRAKYQYRGHVRADRQHVLCFQCYRAARERLRAQQLSKLPFEATAPLDVPLGVRAHGTPAASRLDAQLEHRKRMLAHLESVR